MPDLDFKLTKKFFDEIVNTGRRVPIPRTFQRNYRYDGKHWSFNMIIGGMFVSFPLLLILGPGTDFTIDQAAIFFILILIFVTNRKAYFYKKGIFSYGHLFMFALIGLALNLFAAGILLNKYLPLDHRTESFKIIDYTFQ